MNQIESLALCNFECSNHFCGSLPGPSPCMQISVGQNEAISLSMAEYGKLTRSNLSS
jgi:hypothetical protein